MKLNLHNFEAAAIDFDGTLAVSHPAHMIAREHAFAENGIEVTELQKSVGHRHGNNPTTIIGGILKASGHIPMDADPYTDQLVSQVVATKNRHYAELSSQGFEPQPGALELVDRVVAAYGVNRVAIVTTAPLSDVEPFILRHGLEGYFTEARIVTRDTAEVYDLELKPAPDQYTYAARMLGVMASHLLVVEDTTGGVIAGHEAGSPVLAVGTTSPRDIFYASGLIPPDYYVDDLTHIDYA